MKQLRKYGQMFAELSLKIQDDIKNKSNAELIEIEKEARSVNDRNCSWADYRIARTVLEYVCDEQRNRAKQVQ